MLNAFIAVFLSLIPGLSLSQCRRPSSASLVNGHNSVKFVVDGAHVTPSHHYFAMELMVLAADHF